MLLVSNINEVIRMHFNYDPFETEELLFSFENEKECQEFLDNLYQKLIDCKISDEDIDGSEWRRRSLKNIEKIRIYFSSDDDEIINQYYQEIFERSAALRDDFNYWNEGQRLFRMGDGNDLEIRHYVNALFDFIDMQS